MIQIERFICQGNYKLGTHPSRASRVFQRETSLKPAFRTCFENAPSKRGLRRNFFFYSFHRAYMDFKALHRCETHCIFSWDRHCQLRMYSINLGLICLLHFPVLFKLSGIHFLILFQVASAFCVPAILLALQGFRFKRLVNSFSTCRTETLRWPCRFAMDGQAFAPSLYIQPQLRVFKPNVFWGHLKVTLLVRKVEL